MKCFEPMPKHRKPELVTQYLEAIARDALEEHEDVVRKFISQRNGIYALYRKGRLYYAGLASDLRYRLKAHLKNRHSDSWDTFSVYLTIGDKHLMELEALVLRMVRPPGNKQLGKFHGAQNLWRNLHQEIKCKHASERARMLGLDEDDEDDSGQLPKPIVIRAIHRNRTYRAVLKRNWQIRWNKKVFNSPSAAGYAVRKQAVNGWFFWQYERSPGDWVPLNELRN